MKIRIAAQDCYSFPDAPHCSSCHEDVDYGYEMCTHTRDGIEISCCCKANDYLEELSDEEIFKIVKREDVRETEIN